MTSTQNHSSVAGNMTANVNRSDHDSYYQPSRESWYWAIMGIICVVATIGNSLVILLVCSKKSFRNKVSPNWFIVSLGVSDLLIATFNIPVHFICSFTTMCTHTNVAILFCLSSEFLTASATNVCLLTFDIYLAVFHPFSYPNLMSPTKSRIFLVSGWILSTIVNIPFFVSALAPAPDTDVFLVDQVLTIVFYSLAGAFLTYAFCRIMMVVRSHKKEIEKHQLQIESNVNSRVSLTNPSSSTPISQVRRRNRDGTIRATGVVTASFIVCSLIWEYKLVHFMFSDYIPMSGTAADVADLVIHCNCSINFIVYALLRNDLRGELTRFFRKISRKTRNNNSTSTLSQMRQGGGYRETGSLFLASTKADEQHSNGV